MALSGIEIYKLLPKTNCKDCGFPTCLAFSMKLAAKQVELSACPHVTEESKEKLAASAAPPIRLVTLKSNGFSTQAGNETVLFRHEKTFYHMPGIFVRVPDTMPIDEIKTLVNKIHQFSINYVGIDLTIDGFAIESITGDPNKFSQAVSSMRAVSHKPVILKSSEPAVIAAGLQAVDGEKPLIFAANADNWAEMSDLAKQHQAALCVQSGSLDELAALTEKIKGAGVEDLVLAPMSDDMSTNLRDFTLLRRLALKKNFAALGYPIISFPSQTGTLDREILFATQNIIKYGGFVVLDTADYELLYALLVLRQNIYTDPQKPIQVTPGLYEINMPDQSSPLLVTTNFSITYFSVANEVESAGLPAWLLVCDAEGMSVLTAWAAGKFDAERIAKDAKQFKVAEKVNHKSLVLPGHVAVLSGELEEEMPGWEIRVGPREAVDLPGFIKDVLEVV